MSRKNQTFYISAESRNTVCHMAAGRLWIWIAFVFSTDLSKTTETLSQQDGFLSLLLLYEPE
ncbi:MAG: hypothetical protein DSY90_00525 [Deltaproteobacteria bacterium]|nr:MAG: hypothetical protein DSY90_00525 [Deltaproteobacteria bacterium]